MARLEAAGVRRDEAGFAPSPRRQFRELVRVRRRLTFRAFRRHEGEAMATIVFVAILVPFPLVSAFLSGMAYVSLPEPWPEQVLGMVLAGLWIGWMLYPAIISPLSDAVDLRRLLPYPLSPAVITAAMVAGSVFDIATFFTAPFFVAIAVAWVATPAYALVLAASALAYFHMVVASQLVAAAFSGILHSRRFRDVFVAVAALVGMAMASMQLWSEKLGPVVNRWVRYDRVPGVLPMDVLEWTPPGAAARAIALAWRGEWLGSLVWLGYDALLLGAIAWVWWRVVLRASQRGGVLFSFGATSGAVESSQSEGRPDALRRLLRRVRWLGPQERWLVSKELRLLWRTPYRRMSLLQAVFMPVVLGVVMFRDGVSPGALAFLPAAFAGMASMIVHQNAVAVEGAGLVSILLSPLPRAKLFVAKGIANGMLVGAPLIAGTAVLFAVSGDARVLAGLGAAVPVAASIIALSHAVSVKFPIRIPEDGKRRAFSGGGSLAAMLSAFLVPIGGALVSAPGWGLLLSTLFVDSPALLFATALFGLAYGALLFRLGARLTGRLLLSCESDIYRTLELGKNY